MLDEVFESYHKTIVNVWDFWVFLPSAKFDIQLMSEPRTLHRQRCSMSLESLLAYFSAFGALS